MDLNNLTNEQKANLINNYIRNQERQEWQTSAGNHSLGVIIAFLIVIAVILSFAFPGEVGEKLAFGCVGFGLLLAIFVRVGKWFSTFNEHHHNPLQ